MRFFIDNFIETHNKDWLFGHFPAYEYYPSTGTHIGTDFIVPIGTQIFAPINGEMFKVFYDKYKGNVGIYIFKHKEIEWGLELCHLRELPNRGKYKEGEIIAYSGNTGGKTTGPHLHAVLHRDAMVRKHYQFLISQGLVKKGREAFLKLKKEGAIVDCFDWFCNVIEEEKMKKEKVETPITPGTVVKKLIVKYSTIFDKFINFIISIFQK